MASVVGEVFVAVRPLTAGFSKDLEAQLKGSLGGTGLALGKEIETEITGATAGVGAAVSGQTKIIQKEAEAMSGAFGRFGNVLGAIKSQAVAALGSLTGQSALTSAAFKDLAVSGETVVATELEQLTADTELAAAQARLLAATVANAEAQDALAVAEATLGAGTAELAVEQQVAAAASLELAAAQEALAAAETTAAVAAGAETAALGPLLAVGAAIGIVAFAGVKNFQSLTGEVRNFKNITGASAEEASRFVAAANILGVSGESLGRSMFQLSKKIEAGKLNLADFGTEVARNQDGTINLTGTVLNIADAFQKAGPGAERNALAFQAFGRQGLALVPILARGRQGLEELFAEADKNHVVFSDADIQKGLEFKVATGELKESFKGLSIEVGRVLIPILSTLVQIATEVFQGLGIIAHGVGIIVHGIEILLPPLRIGIDLLGKIGHFFGIGGKHASQAAGDVNKLTTAMEENVTASSTLTAAQTKLATVQAALTGSAAPTIDFAARIGQAQATLSEKTDAVTSAQDALTAAYGRAKPDASELANDTKALSSAQQEQEKATKDLTDALQAQLDAENAVIEATTQLGDLQATVADDTATLKDAQTTLAEAQKKLSDLTKTNGADLDKQSEATKRLRDSELRLAEARQGIIDAAVNLRDKQNELGKAIDEFGPQSIEAAKAQDDLAHAHLDTEKAAVGVKDATDEHNKAQKELVDASAGSEAAQKRLADAQKAVDQATRSVDGAVRSLAKATADYATTQDAANGHVDTAAEKAGHLRDAYNGIAATLAPDSPLRKNITDTANAIVTLNQAANTVQLQSLPGANLPGGAQDIDTIHARQAKSGIGSPGGVTVNVYPAAGQSEAATAQQVANRLSFNSGGGVW